VDAPEWLGKHLDENGNDLLRETVAQFHGAADGN
jgi:hypothetical protein